MGPGDRFHAFVDRRMRATGGVGNVCQCVLALDGSVDVELLRERTSRLPSLPTHVRVEDGPPDPELFWDAHWNATSPLPDGGATVIVRRGEGRSSVLFRWPHARMDAPGADRWLQLLDAEDPTGFRLTDEPTTLIARARGRRGRWGVFAAAHGLALRTLASAFVSRPWCPERGDSIPAVAFHTFSLDETARIREGLGPAGNHRLLAASVSGVASALGARGDLLVPCPLDLRPGAWKGPILSNYFSTVVLRLKAAELADAARGAEHVREVFLDALRRGEDAVLPYLFGLAGRAPDFVTRALFGAEDPSSLLFSNVSFRVGGAGTWLGVPLTRVLLAAHVAPSPGVCVMLSTVAGRLTVAVPTAGVDGAAVLQAVKRRIAGEEDGWNS